ncbi:hypothetical protein ABFV62_28725, partial [Pseudomonas syringae]|uniref:hypothetical protein n=2 Tax=Pseudomonas TaxID=286 RepID=UPI0034D3A6A3
VRLTQAYDVVTDTKKLDNLGDVQILKLTEEPLPPEVLSVVVPDASSYLRYRAQDQSVLSLEWADGAASFYYYPEESSTSATVPAKYQSY